MTATSAKELFRWLTSQYFGGAAVIDNRQRGDVKPQPGLVSIATDAVKRGDFPNYELVNGTLVDCRQLSMSATIDLFTHGRAVVENGSIAGYENTAVEDMTMYADYLCSSFVGDICNENDVTLLIDGEIQDVSDFINDVAYEYRARMTVVIYFTQRAIGRAHVLGESSIRYPVYLVNAETGEFMRDACGNPIIKVDPVTGKEVYTTTPPVETRSTTNGAKTNAQEIEAGAIIVPDFEQTSTGGGTVALASEDDGYFVEVDEIKEVITE